MFLQGMPVLGQAAKLKQPWQVQSFEPDQGALAQIFRATAGADPLGTPGHFQAPGVLSDWSGLGQVFGRAPKAAKGWEDIWSMVASADVSTKAQLNKIFESLNPRGLEVASKRGISKLEGYNPGFLKEFTGGVSSFLQEKGDWEWDFEQNRWKKTQARETRDWRKNVAEKARGFLGQRSTLGQDWAAKHVTTTKY